MIEDRCSCPSPSTCSYCSRMYPCDCAGCDVRKSRPAVNEPTDDPIAVEPGPSAWAVISGDRVIYLSLSWSSASTVAARERTNGIGATVVGLWERDADQAFLDGYGAAYMACKRTMAGYPGFVRMAEYEADANAALVQWHKDIAGEPDDGGEVDPESSRPDRAEYP